MPPKGQLFFLKDVVAMCRRGLTEDLIRVDLRARGCPKARVSQLIRDARLQGALPVASPQKITGARSAAPAADEQKSETEKEKQTESDGERGQGAGVAPRAMSPARCEQMHFGDMSVDMDESDGDVVFCGGGTATPDLGVGDSDADSGDDEIPDAVMLYDLAEAAQFHCIAESGVEKFFEAEAGVDADDDFDDAVGGSDVDEKGDVKAGQRKEGIALERTSSSKCASDRNLGVAPCPGTRCFAIRDLRLIYRR